MTPTVTSLLMDDQQNNLSQEEKQVIKAYLDLKFPGAFGGLKRFYSVYKTKYSDTKLKFDQLKKIIEKIPIYQLHVTKRKQFRRRKTNVPHGSLSNKLSR